MHPDKAFESFVKISNENTEQRCQTYTIYRMIIFDTFDSE
jgi:hypothetical protein